MQRYPRYDISFLHRSWELTFLSLYYIATGNNLKGLSTKAKLRCFLKITTDLMDPTLIHNNCLILLSSIFSKNSNKSLFLEHDWTHEKIYHDLAATIANIHSICNPEFLFPISNRFPIDDIPISVKGSSNSSSHEKLIETKSNDYEAIISSILLFSQEKDTPHVNEALERLLMTDPSKSHLYDQSDGGIMAFRQDDSSSIDIESKGLSNHSDPYVNNNPSSSS